MGEAKAVIKTDQPEVIKPKPKLHIWNQILEDDELSEKLAASMNKFGDEFSRRFIRKKRNRKNKKKKKGKKDSNTVNNYSNGTSQPKDVKPEVKNQNVGQPQSKPQQSNKPNPRWNNQRQGGFSKKKERLSNRILTEEAENISRKLKEKRIDLIIRTIRFLGLDVAMKLCSEVLTIEEAGGLMTMNGTRRRTPGGIFFHLIRSSGRYDASIVSKLFKEGENKEPVFKSRNKSKKASTTTSDASVTNLTNEIQPKDNNCDPIATIETIQRLLPIVQLAEPLQQQEPEKLTQTIDSMDLKASDVPVNGDVRMEEDEDDEDDEDDDDLENSKLVIVEYDASEMHNGNTDRNSEQLIKCTFPDNPNSPNINILCQPSPPTPTINQNVPMFTTNRISVDA